MPPPPSSLPPRVLPNLVSCSRRAVTSAATAAAAAYSTAAAAGGGGGGGRPLRYAVLGAGFAGLSVAWHLLKVLLPSPILILCFRRVTCHWNHLLSRRLRKFLIDSSIAPRVPACASTSTTRAASAVAHRAFPGGFSTRTHLKVSHLHHLKHCKL